MPFKSTSQQRFMFAKHPNIAKRWAKETPSFSVLPKHLRKPSKAVKHPPAEERGESMPDMELGEIMPGNKKSRQ